MENLARLAIAGFGLVGRRHADAIAKADGVELHCVIEPGPAGQAAAFERGITCYETLDDFFAHDSADGVILATPNRLHVEQALVCVVHKCPVLVEKPIATRSQDAERLVLQSEEADVPLLVGHHRRHNPLIARAKEAIDQGLLGDIRAVQATCWFYKPDAYFDVAEWRKQSGAGPVSVNLVHDIDLIRYLCGEVKTVRATAHASKRGYQNEDVAGALLDFEEGAIGTITVSDSVVAPWSWELTSQEYPIYPNTTESCYLIGGSRGSMSVPDLRLWHYADGERDWWSPISIDALRHDATDPLVNQIVHFADVIRGVADPLVSGREGLQTLRVIEAIQTSARTGDAVEIDATLRLATERKLENI